MTKKTKNFETLAKELLTKEQIEKANFNAQIRYQMMTEVSARVKKEMEINNIGFNELVKHMGTSPTQINKILNGSANITIDSLAKVCAVFDIEPHIIFKKSGT